MEKLEGKMDYFSNIKIMSSVRQTIRALYIIINILRVVAVVFLVLQSFVILTRDKA